MPRFHFHVRDGVTILDERGVELASWEEARLEAIRYAGEIFKDNPQRVKLGEDWLMEVTDEQGLILFRVDFRVMESPAMLGSHSPKFDPP